MRRFIIYFFILVGSFASFAQEKTFTMEEAILGYHLYPKGLSDLQWMTDHRYSFRSTENGEQQVIIHELEETRNAPIKTFALKDLNESLLNFDPKLDTLRSIPAFKWLGMDELQYFWKGNYLAYHIGDRKTRKTGSFSKEGLTVYKTHESTLNQAYIKDQQLYVQTNGGNPVQLTTDGGNGIVYGQAVHRNEFGIMEGLFWSDKGDALAFYRMDESMVSNYPLYNLSDTPATANETRYPTAGRKSHHVTVGVHHLQSGRTLYLQTGKPEEQYLTNIAWDPESKFVYIAVVNRQQNHMWLNKYDASSGAFIKTLFEEQNPKYVEPEHPAQFLKSDHSKFLWWSERDGYNHLYLYDTSGKQLKQLTKGNWVVTDLIGLDEQDENLFVITTTESPLDRDLFCVNMKNGKSRKISRDPGTHSIIASPNMVHFLDRFSNTVTPTEVRIIDKNGVPVSTIHTAENPLKDYKLGAMEIGDIKAKDGTRLYYRLFKPTDFDPSKKYPVIVYLYNGPHVQLVRNTWLGGANLWYQYLAQRGYLVFTIDGRGSANRGFEFESAVHRRMGYLEMEDQLTGLNWLIAQGYADTGRMGVHGWSYGGFMTTSLMTRHPGIFKVGVAGGPVIDWTYYEVMYTERYMDTPQENPDGYKENNLLNYVDKLEGRLLMIHGAQDATVLWQHSLLYLEKAIKAGVTGLDYYVYPHHEHNVNGKDRAHLYHKVTEYLMRELEN
ncbi:MAG: DPP IV N-terminal domain-containing protein [Flavobacteriales bacterium]|nr:DPP IV N-terminal domain-containing protein [Flavobacteriales bacterium]